MWTWHMNRGLVSNIAAKCQKKVEHKIYFLVYAHKNVVVLAATLSNDVHQVILTSSCQPGFPLLYSHHWTHTHRPGELTWSKSLTLVPLSLFLSLSLSFLPSVAYTLGNQRRTHTLAAVYGLTKQAIRMHSGMTGMACNASIITEAVLRQIAWDDCHEIQILNYWSDLRNYKVILVKTLRTMYLNLRIEITHLTLYWREKKLIMAVRGCSRWEWHVQDSDVSM